MPGSTPFMPRSIFCMPPLATIFIIFCVCSNCARSWLTSCTDTPAPAAMRRGRVRAGGQPAPGAVRANAEDDENGGQGGHAENAARHEGRAPRHALAATAGRLVRRTVFIV